MHYPDDAHKLCATRALHAHDVHLLSDTAAAGAIAVSLISFVIKLGLIPYALPAIMPTWRWWLAATLVGGGLLSAFWIRDWIAGSHPDFRSEPADVFGVLMGVIITISFIAGVAVRGMTLMMSARGIRPGYGVAVTIAGFGFMVAILVLPILL
jgi:hypothetical protein